MENQELLKYYLYPASVYVCGEPCEITTVLGSCVSVCIYDVSMKIGGMNHFLLPFWNGEGLASPKYGNVAIDKLLDKLMTLGCNSKNMLAKVFGGANVLKGGIPYYSVGLRNIELAKDILNDKMIRIIASSTGGELGRKILFNTYTGEVKQRFLQNGSNKIA